MADKLMYCPNDDNQNYSFSRLQLGGGKLMIQQKNQNSIKVPKLIEATYKKTLGTSV